MMHDIRHQTSANLGFADNHDILAWTIAAKARRDGIVPLTAKICRENPTMPKQRGPAADPRFLPTIDSSNPYNFPPSLFAAAKLPPKVTENNVFFLGHEGPEPECCFSQWFAAPFTSPDGKEFPTAEHYMMYSKATLMNDHYNAARILAEAHPSAAKRLGREVKNYNRQLWAKSADVVVEEGNWMKFSQNEDLAEALLGTKERVLVEASPEDRIWGIGFDAESAEGREEEWGDNRMGKALMNVRERLRREGETGNS